MKKTKILFVSETVTLAHAARPIILANSLDTEIFDIHFAWEERYQDLFSNLSQKIKFHHLYSISSQEFLEALAKGNPVYDKNTLKRYVADDLQLIREIKPDIVVGDFRLSLSVSAELENVPYLSINNAYWSPYVDTVYHLAEHPLVDLIGYRLAQKLFNLVRPLIFSVHCLPLNQVRKSYGLKSLGFNLKQIYTHANYSLYADVPTMFPSQNIPSNHYFLGPIVWNPEIELPEWWDKIPQNKPVIYCSFGSSGAVNLLSKLIEKLLNLDVVMVIATAGRFNNQITHDQIFYADFLPGEKAVKRADLVICNGGSPSTHQALSSGVPVLGIVSNMDQMLNMQAVVDSNAGEVIRAGEIGQEKVISMVQNLLNDEKYKLAAKKVEQNFKKYDAKGRFVNFINMLIAEKS